MGNTSVNPPGPSTLERVESAWRDQQPIYRRATVLTGTVAIIAAAAAIHRSFDALNVQRSSAVGTDGSGHFTAIPATASPLIIELSIIASIAVVAMLTGAAALVDLHEHRLPNRLLRLSTRTVALAAVVIILGRSIAAGRSNGSGLSDLSSLSGEAFSTVALVGIGAIGGGLPLLIVLLQRGIGMGDVKLAAVLGAAGGLVHPGVGLATVALMAIAASSYAVIRRQRALALGPWLWGAWVVAVIAACITTGPVTGTSAGAGAGAGSGSGEIRHRFQPAPAPSAQPAIERVEMSR